ncbi:hypothetical protein EYR36_003915 [Pleurotus pulmonarius]|nr:hypothetical protein EYR36_003915 [Pleurotus pulmonarius]
MTFKLSIHPALETLLGVYTFHRFKHTAAAAEAQRRLDAEIAAHEATIRDLKHQRNTYSSVSRLPSEIAATIFLLVKTELGQAAVGAIGGVCRQWREILLASPRIWSSIEVSRLDYALELLQRANSVPLEISCEERSYTDPCRRVAEVVMSEVSRIQSLGVSLHPTDLVQFLRLNRNASAPILENLRLSATSTHPEPFTLPHDILHREMPSLRQLVLNNMGISLQLPPLPQLIYLRIATHSIDASLILASIKGTPKLEELHIEGLVLDDCTDSLETVIRLPNLTNISLAAMDLEDAAMLTKIEYPPGARVHFSHKYKYWGEPDLSTLVGVCRRLQIDPLPIDTVLLSSRSRGQTQMIIGVHHHEPYHLNLSLNIEPRYSPASCMTLCSALSLGDVSILKVVGFSMTPPTEWPNLYRCFPQARSLHLIHTSTWYFRTLMQGSTEEPPLPALETLRFSQCEFLVTSAQLIKALKALLKERKALNTPVATVIIRMSSITEEAVKELEDLTEVDWDGEVGIGDVDGCVSRGSL